MAIIACVPSISEGRDKKIVQTVVTAIKNASDVDVLGIDMGRDSNRTVITFAGTPKNVKEAAFACIKKASEIIDMSKHTGKHMRLGCVDVCPFIPIEKADEQDCVKLAQELGAKVGSELGIPVYLYGLAAATTARQSLDYIRKGEYEHLAIKLQNTPPDYGTSNYDASVKKTGAISIGARNCLVDFNITLDTQNEETAEEIAKTLREAGKTGTGGGMLKGVRARGLFMEEYGKCQILFNIEDYKKTPLYIVYETCKTEAAKYGVKITGTQIIGLVPKDLILDSSKFYLNKQSKITLGMSMRDVVDVSVKNMGLDEFAPFDMNEKILEFKLKSLN